MQTKPATDTRSAFFIAETAPVLPANLSLAVAPEARSAVRARPPSARWHEFAATPAGTVAQRWLEGLGAVVPAVVTAGAGHAIGSINGSAESAFIGLMGGLFAGFCAMLYYNYDESSLLPSFRRAGHPCPALAALREISAYCVMPACATGLAMSAMASGGWGVTTAAVVGAIGGAFAEQVHGERLKREKPPSVDNERR